MFKTVLCKNWEAEGKCQWGEQCKWAYGKEDVRAGESVTHRLTLPAGTVNTRL